MKPVTHVPARDAALGSLPVDVLARLPPSRSAWALNASAPAAFDALAASFARARDRCLSDVRVTNLRLAGSLIQLRVVGPELADRLTAVFAPRAVPLSSEPAAL